MLLIVLIRVSRRQKAERSVIYHLLSFFLSLSLSFSETLCFRTRKHVRWVIARTFACGLEKYARCENTRWISCEEVRRRERKTNEWLEKDRGREREMLKRKTRMGWRPLGKACQTAKPAVNRAFQNRCCPVCQAVLAAAPFLFIVPLVADRSRARGSCWCLVNIRETTIKNPKELAALEPAGRRKKLLWMTGFHVDLSHTYVQHIQKQ